MFDVHYQPAYNLVLANLHGFLSIEVVQAYVEKVEPLILRAAERSSGYPIVIDVSQCAIQSQEVVAAFQAHVARMPQARRCAVVTGSSIIRMQIRRIVLGTAVEMFEDRVAAINWALEW